MLPERYEPRSAQQLIGNRQKVLGILKWLRNWKKGKSLLLYGPSGTGKSLAAKIAAKELGYELVASYASDDRDAVAIKETLLKAARQKSMFYKGKLLVIDDADALDSARAVIELVQNSDFPVMIIAGDAYGRKLRALRNYCTMVRFEKIAADAIENHLKRIAALEKVSITTPAIRKIALSCNGDVRAALIDMEFGGDARDYDENIFAVVRKIFKAKSIGATSEALRSVDESVIPWLEENVANEYRSSDEIATAYDYLSKADLFSSRITKRQSWTLQKFSYNLAAFGVALSKKRVYLNSYYAPPRRFYGNSGAMEKIALKLGISRKIARGYVPLISALLAKNPTLAEKFSFDSEDVERIKAAASK